MRILPIALILVGCASIPAMLEHEARESSPAPAPVLEPESEAVAEDAAKPVDTRRARPPKPPDKKEAPAARILPPCESVPGDKQTAILQKLECVAETADKKPRKP